MVKGTNFRDLRDSGDPVECAIRYEKERADELVILDVSATDEGRRTALFEALAGHEMTGLALHAGAPRPLDVDVHDIPARGGEPAHLHLDLRYLVLAPAEAALARSPMESDEVRWFGWDELGNLDLDAGLRRALGKTRAFL